MTRPGTLRARWTVLLAVAFLGALFARADEGVAPLSEFPQGQLAIRTAAGNVHNFKIWIADRPARQEQGLMFVKSMDDHAGMLFVYPRDQKIAMWMMNTFIPLDMLFIAGDGRVVYIAENTVPQSPAIIGPKQEVRSVLEINGGLAARLGVRPGDRVSSTALESRRVQR